MRAFHVTGSFASPEDLDEVVERRLRELDAEDVARWCKLGLAVFRATSLSAPSPPPRASLTYPDVSSRARTARLERFGRLRHEARPRLSRPCLMRSW